ncbi:universal stress protein [Cytophagales bacterium LB-30]|uniref:Universal stress protein n=1 Tax=Shiella aurantiaca TaxID=3058365 RepID=A0ABT8F518_9BACT|nr:universal stress protein [Shiella aurantiaca]MDN4165541.1 universal stress protein [Shiella aurantiaca]
MFSKVAVAIAFSPRCEALMSEARRLRDMFQAELVIIHVGEKLPEDEAHMNQLLEKTGIGTERVKVVWEQGDPAEKILAVCKQEHIDLLLAGALKKENLIKHYVGSIARKILRKAKCSVLMLTNPAVESATIKSIVIQGEDSPYVVKAIEAGCKFAQLQKSKQVHIIREIKMYGLTMSVASEQTEEEYSDTKKKLVADEIKKVEDILATLDTEGLKINIKIIAGKSGFELANFAEKFHADLIVAGAPQRSFSFFSRVFPHHLEYIFAEMPCDVLIVNS